MLSFFRNIWLNHKEKQKTCRLRSNLEKSFKRAAENPFSTLVNSRNGHTPFCACTDCEDGYNGWGNNTYVTLLEYFNNPSDSWDRLIRFLKNQEDWEYKNF